jgi:divalent metal cation (Fe/Co/Zn/Cd) transporter
MPPLSTNDGVRETDPVDADELRRAIRWSAASVAWTVGSSSVAIVAGLANGSILLVVFGSIGAMDLIGSLVLVAHFRHVLRHQSVSERRERAALLAIALGMGVITVGTIVISSLHLIEHSTVQSSVAGSAVVGSSIVALGVLTVGKRRVARRLGSRPLLADSQLSTIGASLAAFTTAGTVAATSPGWWWLDPVGSLLIALAGTVAAVGHARSG